MAETDKRVSKFDLKLSREVDNLKDMLRQADMKAAALAEVKS